MIDIGHTSDMGAGTGAPALVQIGAAVALTVFSASQSLMVELVKVNGKVPFHTPTAVLYTEGIKLVVSLSVWAWQLRHLETTGLETFKLSASLSYAIPALLYVLQNNIIYVAMTLLDPPTFQLWACFKLIPAGVLARLVLGQRRTGVQWAALLLLALGMATTKLTTDCARSAASEKHMRGIGLLLFNGTLSAASGVCNEWLIKYQDPRSPLMLKNAHIYLFGMIFSLVSARGPSTGGLDGYSSLGISILFVNAATGLCVSFVLKYTDNLVKGFSTSAAVLLAAVASAVCCGFEVTREFCIGVAVVTAAFYLYFGGHNELLSEAERSRATSAPEQRGLLETDEPAKCRPRSDSDEAGTTSTRV